ncbi:peroxisomal ATPase pex [Salix suchowensis]|nr:peroxisomal ATPase pex [Salix suchowensis]
MYTGIFKCRNQRWCSLFHASKHFMRPNCQDLPLRCTTVARDHFSHVSFIKRKLLHSISSRSTAFGNIDSGLHIRSNISGANGRNTSEDKHGPVKDGASFDNEKTQREQVNENAKHCDAHAQLGEQDQKEWLHNEKLAIESKRKESPFLTRREKFKNEFLRRIVPWEKLRVSWDNFPYYINEHTKNILVECVASHLKHKKCTTSYGARLSSSSGRIMLQSVPGTELYWERTVEALARDLQVPLLVLDSSVLAPYDFGDDESESDDSAGSVEETCSESEVEDDNDAVNEEEWTSSAEAKSDSLKKLLPCSLEEFEKYIGPSIRIEADDRVLCFKPLSSGQLGEVYEVNGDRVAVILDIGNDNKEDELEKDEKLTEHPAKALVYWIDAKDIEHDPDTEMEYCYIATEVLCEVLRSMQPLIVYFPDSSQWLSRAVPKSNRKDFLNKVQEMFDKLSSPVVLICGQNKAETGSKEKERFTMVLLNIGRLAKLPLSLKHLTDGLKGEKRSNENDITKLFINVLCLYPPKCLELNKTVLFTGLTAEKVIGWAKNHYLSSSLLPCIKGDRLSLPRGSLEIAIVRLKEQETISEKPNFVSAVVAPGEIGVKFNDVGALEEVKKALNELVILPMRRPELYSHGNLLRPCKGILLFGPPGTGKTLLAKALATEAGANFISITGSTLTSKWFGDAEKLTKALFSFASKLAPVIIFVDEIDSLLGARGGSFEHEATRRRRNEFMAAWDGLRSKDSQRILILGATNRPFDLDDAVIRWLPRRIHVDLPDAKNRMKILRIILNRENLESDFQFDKLANATEGYSGSDLKNLCIAAAYRPVEELLEEEKILNLYWHAFNFILQDFRQSLILELILCPGLSKLNELWLSAVGEY